MALNKSNPPNQYIPFQETSFGFGSGAVAAEHTNLAPTDIVKVRIGFISGTHWDLETGHISTPSVGTAVSTFNKHNSEWIVRGELADVDAVLAQLQFFPSDYPSTRNWTVDIWKENQTTGVYPVGEQPPQIPDTRMTLTVHDASDTFLSGHSVWWEATGYDYDNNRPYFSVEPSVQDVSALGNPPKIDLGTIAHVPDTDNVTVTCEFRHYNATTSYTGTAYGSFTRSDRMYIGDKKEGTRDIIEKRFNFTGSLVEAQTFLDNIGYNRTSTEQTFDMVLRVSDGAVGSEVTKTCWFSDYPFEPTLPMPDLVGTEEQNLVGLNAPQNWDINYPAEVNEFWFTITLDTVGTDGVTYISEGTLTNGVFTSNSYTSTVSLRSIMNAVLFQFRDDFNDDFTFNIQFHGRNQTLGTSYSSTAQTVNVTMADASEFSNLYTTHNYTEDTRYRFAIDGVGLPNIAHGYNREYTARIVVSDPNAVEVIWCSDNTYTSGVDFFFENGNQLRMVGTRDQINQMLYSVYFEPATDYDQNFTFSYYQTRLGGDTTSDAAEGDYYNVEIGAANCITMVCSTSHDEYSFTAPNLEYVEDINLLFDTGIRVTDLSDEHEYTTSYQTEYTVTLKMVDASGNDFNYGVLTPTSGTLTSSTGNGQGSNPRVMTGSKTEINTALANMKYITELDESYDFFIQFKVERDFDSTVFADFDQTRQITVVGLAVEEVVYSPTPNVNWNWNTRHEFNSDVEILDHAADNQEYSFTNRNYEVRLVGKYWDGSQALELSTVTFDTDNLGVAATKSGTGTVADPLIITGSRTDVNTALANLALIPDLDWSTSPAADGTFWLEAKVTRLEDLTIFLNNVAIKTFNAGTETSGVNTDWGDFTYTEDVLNQSVFSTHGNTILEEVDQLTSGTIEYEVTVSLGTTSYGEFRTFNYLTNSFDEYVEDQVDYVDDDYVNSHSITFYGDKNTVNYRITALQFSPYADAFGSSNIQIEAKRFIDGVEHKGLTTGAIVGNLAGVENLAEFVYGTANNNVQYFVPSDFINGTNVNETEENILNGTADSILHPQRIASNLGLSYDRPVTVVDTYEEGGPSQYRMTFSSVSLGGSFNYNDTGWNTKEGLHTILDEGIYPTNFTSTSASFNSSYTLSFTLHRRTYLGNESQIAQGTLTYILKSGIFGYKMDRQYVSGSFANGDLVYTYVNEPVMGTNNVYLQNSTWIDESLSGYLGDRFAFSPVASGGYSYPSDLTMRIKFEGDKDVDAYDINGNPSVWSYDVTQNGYYIPDTVSNVDYHRHPRDYDEWQPSHPVWVESIYQLDYSTDTTYSNKSDTFNFTGETIVPNISTSVSDIGSEADDDGNVISITVWTPWGVKKTFGNSVYSSTGKIVII